MFRGILTVGICGAALTMPLLAGDQVFADNFDTGNSVGEKPSGWMVNETPGSGDQVRIVDKNTVAPASLPYCIQLSDASAPEKKSNPFFNHRFQPLPSGKVTCRLQIPSAKQGPATVELLSRTGAKSASFFRLTFESNGKISYSVNPGDLSGSTTTSIPWQPSTWQAVEITWTAASQVSATLDGHPIVEDLSLSAEAPPSEFKIRTGGASIAGQVAYADDIVIEQTPN